MHSTRDLRHRIRSVGNTARITKAMQMVAASKMRKAQEAAIAGRPFVRMLYRMQREVTTGIGDLSDPLHRTVSSFVFCGNLLRMWSRREQMNWAIPWPGPGVLS